MNNNNSLAATMQLIMAILTEADVAATCTLSVPDPDNPGKSVSLSFAHIETSFSYAKKVMVGNKQIGVAVEVADPKGAIDNIKMKIVSMGNMFDDLRRGSAIATNQFSAALDGLKHAIEKTEKKDQQLKAACN